MIYFLVCGKKPLNPPCLDKQGEGLYGIVQALRNILKSNLIFLMCYQ